MTAMPKYKRIKRISQPLADRLVGYYNLNGHIRARRCLMRVMLRPRKDKARIEEETRSIRKLDARLEALADWLQDQLYPDWRETAKERAAIRKVERAT